MVQLCKLAFQHTMTTSVENTAKRKTNQMKRVVKNEIYCSYLQLPVDSHNFGYEAMSTTNMVHKRQQ